MKINYVGESVLKIRQAPVKGDYVTIDGEQFYCIFNYDRMAPFFISMVSDSDHWLFISSKGGLTAGRKSPENALFPYITDDKIHDASETTGSKTMMYIETSDKFMLWEPFSDDYKGIYNIQRNIYKNLLGNKIMFEEVNYDLQISFRYSYNTSEIFGIVKKSRITNLADFKRRVSLLDGFQNILPAGVNRAMQTSFSTLVDAYKKNELLEDEGIGIYALSSIPVDKAEPNEALLCSIAWSVGLENTQCLLSSSQLEKFRIERSIMQEREIHGQRGAYFVFSFVELSNNSVKEWYQVIDINKDSKSVLAIQDLFTDKTSLYYSIFKDINKGSNNLLKIVGNADGLQLTADKLISSRHFSNVLFNTMRGGIFDNSYIIDSKDFSSFIRKSNASVARRHDQFLRELPKNIIHSDLRIKVAACSDAQLTRIYHEYLPLTFSRRHGDPSRPWNVFSIDIKKEDGTKILSYQGNWRDIFQNWEALSFSFPEYIESMISKFVNATTADGYNPYRLLREGFDWEVLDSRDPWSNIGYWGDHQIIYLLKLVEFSRDFHPGVLGDLMTSEIFTYARLPYRIRKYNELLKHPNNSIIFDHSLHNLLIKKAQSLGTDGKLILTNDDQPYLVNLTEKFLSLILAKLSNFVPEGGIWMNTQRPEWNDANNALVGRGLSMVTLYYLRRFMISFRDIAIKSESNYVLVSIEIREFFIRILNIIAEIHPKLKDGFNDKNRKLVLDSLGKAGSDYRDWIYKNQFSGKKEKIEFSEIKDFCIKTVDFIDQSIRANERNDGLFHAYNLMRIKKTNSISIENLYEMLEGQVAFLCSGYASAEESIRLLELLKSSELFRPDQNSYMLYPNRKLKLFREKNIIPESEFNRSELMQQLVIDGNDTLLVKDSSGTFHFQSRIRNSLVLNEVLDDLNTGIYQPLLMNEKALVHEIYENVFHHASFTGRSGTFYKYEGLGSIYWHMVSKLLLAVRDIYFSSIANSQDPDITDRVSKVYYEIKEGIGVHKQPGQYGAFPTDPYSHTPAHSGVQQPGMTGQVKEDILTRFGELGLQVKKGCIQFIPSLLHVEEFLTENGLFNFIDVRGIPQAINIEAGCLAFTYCQVPIVYHRSDKAGIKMTKGTGVFETVSLSLSLEDSQHIFQRNGSCTRIDVSVIK